MFNDPMDRFNGSDAAVLHITDVGVDDVKMYICTVEVEGRQRGSAGGALTVISEWGKEGGGGRGRGGGYENS